MSTVASYDYLVVDHDQDSRKKEKTETVTGRLPAYDYYDNSERANSEPTTVLKSESDGYCVLTPKWLNESILNPHIKAKVSPMLLIVSGLPDSSKTTAIRGLLKKLVSETCCMKDVAKNEESSLGFHDGLAVRKPPAYEELIFADYLRHQTYPIVIHSALERVTRTMGETLESPFSPLYQPSSSTYFPSKWLNEHFNIIFFDIMNALTNKKQSFLKDWYKGHTSGLALINIWDVGFGKVASHIFPLLAGHLSNSYVWMFLDLLRDIDHLYESPDIPENRYDRSRNDRELIMKWRPRIHYLLRLAKLASSKNKKRHNVCQIIASLKSQSSDYQFFSEDFASKINHLKEQFETAAKQMNVNELIDTENITIFDIKEGLMKLKQIFETTIHNALDNNSKEVPLSYIFLRSAFYADKQLYIKKDKLQEFANELQISPEGLKEFCHLFTSFGSIIDVSLIDEFSDLVILRPIQFMNKLDKLFYPSFDVDQLITGYGIVTVPTTEAIFGEDASVLMGFLESLKIAVKFPSSQFDVPLQDTCNFAYYVSNIHTSPPVLQCSPTALHLLRDINTPLSHLPCLFASKYFNLYPKNKLDTSMKPHSNFTRFRSFTSSSTGGVVFELVYLGDAVEFRLPDDNEDEEVCQQIVTVCHSIMPEKIKYNFAIMCSLDDQQKSSAYKLTRPRHLLPYKECCEKCNTPITPAIKTWNSVFEKDDNKIDIEQRLNGDPLTKEDAFTLTEKMEKLFNEGTDTLANALCHTKFCKDSDKKDWRHFMKMLIQWEASTDSDEPQSKKNLSELLYTLSTSNKLTADDKSLLEGMARSINFAVDFRINNKSKQPVSTRSTYNLTYMFAKPIEEESGKKEKVEIVTGKSKEKILQYPEIAISEPTIAIQRDYDCRFLTPKWFKDCILNPHIKAKVSPMLLIVSGLPDSSKTTAIRGVLTLKELVSETRYAEEQNLLPLGFYDGLAVRKPPAYEEILIFADYLQFKCYPIVILSALERITRTTGEILQPHDHLHQPSFSESFNSERLNKIFCQIFQNIVKFLTDRKQSSLKDWYKGHTSGLALINIWDVGFGKVASYILPLLAGHLSNSYVWMFLDLLRDIDHLYESPDIPENRYDRSCNDRDLIMKWRPRIHYLLRLAKLASSKDKKRHNACQVIASLKSFSDDFTSKIKHLKEQFETAAKQMNIDELIDTENITIFDIKEGLMKLKQIFETTIHNALDNNSKEISLSHIFLRSAFYTDELLYIRKKELKEFANELQMSPEDFEKFCRLFTSFGSIIDVSLIDEFSDVIILKPVQFINKLDKLFYASAEEYPLVAKYGVVTVSTAEAIFGKDAFVFMSFLESLKIAVKFPSSKFDVPLQDNAYYVSNIHTSPPVLQCNPTALHLLRDINTPLSHFKVLFTKEFLKLNPNNKIVISTEDQHINIVRFKSFTPSSTDDVIFELVYLGDAVEFRLSDDNEDEEVCQQIVTVCHSIMPKNIRYNFAIMCSLDDQQRSSAYKLTRPRHLLPYKECCKKCHTPITPAIKTWNSVLEQAKNEVPIGQRLNGDPLTKEDAFTLTEKMEKLSKEGVDALADALCNTKFSSFCKIPDKKNWRHFMKMLLQWEESTSDSTATGNKSAATGSNSVATGNSSAATGNNSAATSNNSAATSNDSTATGNDSAATGNDSAATGNNSAATSNDSAHDEPQSKKDLSEILYTLSEQTTINMTGEDRVLLKGMARFINYAVDFNRRK